MELIIEIYEKDLGMKPSLRRDIRYRLRRAARGLVFDSDKIAILNVSKLHFHKLPGGGIENEESKVRGFTREVLEETGCRIINVREFGATIEYRGEIEMLQISYSFTCDVIGAWGSPNFTSKEIDEGFQLGWFTIEEAINMMKDKDKPVTYAGKFIQMRDLAILEYYLRCKKIGLRF